VSLELVSNSADEPILIDCSEDQGCTIFYGFSGTDAESGTSMFDEIPLAVSADDELLLNFDGGTTSSGADIPGGPRIGTEVFVYSDQTTGFP